jgi:hypothetical protein
MHNELIIKMHLYLHLKYYFMSNLSTHSNAFSYGVKKNPGNIVTETGRGRYGKDKVGV